MYHSGSGLLLRLVWIQHPRLALHHWSSLWHDQPRESSVMITIPLIRSERPELQRLTSMKPDATGKRAATLHVILSQAISVCAGLHASLRSTLLRTELTNNNGANPRSSSARCVSTYSGQSCPSTIMGFCLAYGFSVPSFFKAFTQCITFCLLGQKIRMCRPGVHSEQITTQSLKQHPDFYSLTERHSIKETAFCASILVLNLGIRTKLS